MYSFLFHVKFKGVIKVLGTSFCLRLVHLSVRISRHLNSSYPGSSVDQEDYIKDEQKNLKKEYLHAQEEVKRIQSVPLVIGQFLEAVDQHTGIVGSTTGSNYYVRILSTLDRELLKPSSSVALHKHSNALVDVLPPEADSSISMLGADEKPDIQYADIGGMDIQKTNEHLRR